MLTLRYFHSPSKGRLSVSNMILEIADFVDDEPGIFYRLVIGTDSQARRNNGESEIDYVTAIVIHRIGKGARYFWRKEKRFGAKVTKLSRNKALRDKIYTETLMSLDVAKKIVPKLRNVISPRKYDFEIHIDVGPIGPTRDMIREVVGIVNGNGFAARTKPESWGASSVADKHA